METHELVSTQESALGYLYAAVSNLESLIQKEESMLETLKRKSGDVGVSLGGGSRERLASNWERRIEELKAALTALKKMVAKEERRLSILLEEEKGGPLR